jgi:hypothetical protein
MRILLTSDLHYKLRRYDGLIGAAPGFDAVVIAVPCRHIHEAPVTLTEASR